MEKLFVYFAFFYETFPSIRLSEKFLPFHEEIIDAQRFFFYIILSNYVRSILFCSDKHRHISHTYFHVCYKNHDCERKILSGQHNTSLRLAIERCRERRKDILRIYNSLRVESSRHVFLSKYSRETPFIRTH